MHRGLLTLAAALVLAAVPFAQVRAAVEVGDTPQFNITTTDGLKLNNQSLRGHVVVIDFWATWCGPCVSTMPHFKKLYEQYHAKGVVFLGVSLDTNRSKMDKFLEDKGYTWPQVFDGKGWKAELPQAWGVRSIPRIFILDPTGKVLFNGHPNSMDQTLHAAVEKYESVMAQAMKRGRAGGDEASQLDAETLESAKQSLTSAGQAMDQDDFKTMLAALGDIPASAYADNAFALQCRELYEKIRGLSRSQQAALNDARRSDRELAKAYGAFVQAARSARKQS